MSAETNIEAADAALAALTELIDAARRAIDAGAMVDLTGLDDEVERVCHALQYTSSEKRPFYVRKLHVLVDAFDALTAELKTRSPA